MRAILEKVPYSILIVLTVVMLLAPFRPAPHVVEKIVMLSEGNLRRPVDLFDLVYHTAPLMVLILKFGLERRWRSNRRSHR